MGCCEAGCCEIKLHSVGPYLCACQDHTIVSFFSEIRGLVALALTVGFGCFPCCGRTLIFFHGNAED